MQHWYNSKLISGIAASLLVYRVYIAEKIKALIICFNVVLCFLSFSWTLPGRAAPQAHPVPHTPPEATCLCAQLPSITDVEDQDREPGPGH